MGDARIYGGELEATLRLTSDLTLNAAISSESATIVKSVNPIDVPVGSSLIDVPQGTIVAGAVYRRALTARLKLIARMDYDWTSHSYGSYQSHRTPTITTRPTAW